LARTRFQRARLRGVRLLVFAVLSAFAGVSVASEPSICVLQGTVLEYAELHDDIHVAITVESAEKLKGSKLGKCDNHIGTDLEFSFPNRKRTVENGSKLEIVWFTTDSELVGYSDIKVLPEE